MFLLRKDLEFVMYKDLRGAGEQRINAFPL